MILVVNICKEKLHYFEFVRPVEEALAESKAEFFTKHYRDLKERDIKKADKIIICGTSLNDNDFLRDLEKFTWLNDFKNPVLGICGGSHIIGLLQGQKLKKDLEIGLKEIKLKEDFLGIKKGEKLNVYHLHGFSALPEIYHKDNYYAVTFHPEVRNRKIIENFAGL